MTGATLLQNGHSKSANSIIVTGALTGPFVQNGGRTEPWKLPAFLLLAPERSSSTAADSPDRARKVRPCASVQNEESRKIIDASLRRNGRALTNEGLGYLRLPERVSGVLQM